jgi:cytochrome c oxidase subunit I
MTDITAEFAPASNPVTANYLNNGTTIWSWLTTTDHKRIGILYALTITFFFFIGGVAIGIVRLELLAPQADIVGAETYNRLFSLHGIIMVWFFLVPSIPTTLGNFLLPMMIGAHDVAFRDSICCRGICSSAERCLRCI